MPFQLVFCAAGGSALPLHPKTYCELRGLYVKKMFVGGLPLESTEDTVTEMFNEYGKVRSIKLASDVFTGKCKGFGFIEMEGHEARAAIAALNGKIIGDKSLKVQFEEPRKGGKRGGRR
jgi:RNA recognition motif-containing protein